MQRQEQGASNDLHPEPAPSGAGQTGAQQPEPVPAGLPGQRPGPKAATRLFLNHKTIKVRLGHIYDKLGVHSRTSLARLITSGPSTTMTGPADQRATTNTCTPLTLQNDLIWRVLDASLLTQDSRAERLIHG